MAAYDGSDNQFWRVSDAVGGDPEQAVRDLMSSAPLDLSRRQYWTHRKYLVEIKLPFAFVLVRNIWPSYTVWLQKMSFNIARRIRRSVQKLHVPKSAEAVKHFSGKGLCSESHPGPYQWAGFHCVWYYNLWTPPSGSYNNVFCTLFYVLTHGEFLMLQTRAAGLVVTHPSTASIIKFFLLVPRAVS